ncbi:MAG: hypothetical protein B7Z37_03400 [Verrucomicrobia bacterium 12-59-8]|nr:MAG: hypothetical protein B7Z37_03400 [Verrucomicrobia bacterium 12-59-8]
MPKLPHVSDREAVRALQKLGFEVSSQKGCHIVMKRGTDGCVVPNHHEIKIGTLAGVSAEEFIAAL